MLEVRLLGKLEAQVSENPPVSQFRSTSAASVLAYLALAIHRIVSKDELCEAVWPESDRALARGALRTALHSLRGTFEGSLPGDVLLRSDRNSVWLDPDLVSSDYKLFQDQAVAGLAQSAPDDRSELLASAVDLVDGPLLPEIEDWWVRPHKIAFEEVFGQAVSQLIRDLADLGHVESAIAIGRAAVTVTPLREDIHVELIRLFNSLGRGSEAIKQYELLEGLLDEQWGEAPSAAATEALDSKPVVRMNSDVVTPDGALRARIFGREAEVEDIAELLLGGARLVSIVGFGGCGKTSVARAVMDRFDRAVFVNLVTMRTVDSVVSHIAAALGLRVATTETLTKQVVAEIQKRGVLLVLDNAEHIVENVSEAVGALLSEAASLRVLVTSRTPLGLSEERIVHVNPLPIPEPDWALARILETPTVRLFEDRARFVSAKFSVTTQNASAVVELCRKSDGVPLAIELLAAKVESLSPAQILFRIADQAHTLTRNNPDIPTRHRSLELAASWSYELLEPNQQKALRALSVFRESFTIEDAEVIANCIYGESTIESLFRASLLEREEHGGEVRFRLLVPLRSFAWDRLVEHGESDEVCLRHREHYVEKAERIWREIDGASPGQSADEAEREEHNFLQILDWAVDRLDWVPHALRLGALLTHYVNLRARGKVWMPRLQRLLQVHDGCIDDHSAARGLVALGAMAMFIPDMPLCMSSLRKGYELYLILGDKVNIAGAANTLGLALVCMPHNDPRHIEEAMPLLSKALEDIEGKNASADWKPSALRAAILSNLGAGYRVQNRSSEAVEALKNGLQHAVSAGVHRYVPGIQLGIADNLLELGRLDEARMFATNAMASARNINSVIFLFQSTITLAHVCHELGENDSAFEHADWALAHAKNTKSPNGVSQTLIFLASIVRKRGISDLSQDLFNMACRVSPIEVGNLRGPAADSIAEMRTRLVPGLPVEIDDPAIDELVARARTALVQSGTRTGS
ncbi:MAG: AAA family ATPase [Chthonomonadaceae bacterium]|nr:AAA family ATPase [Chthonomonadaceae bacterium]